MALQLVSSLLTALARAVPLPVANGGTGASTAPGAASNLGVGTEDSPTFSGLTLTGSLAIAPTGAAGFSIEIGRVDGNASTPFVDFHAGATAVDYDARIIATTGSGVTAGGNLTLDAATVTLARGQVVFPAVQVASAGANTLDDYEEQLAVDLTFTAATPPTSVTYGARSFRFTKVGRIVHGEGRLTLTSKGSGGVGALSLTGLPWTASGVGVTKNIRAANFTGSAIPSSGIGLVALISGTALGLGYSTNANDANDLAWADVTDTFDAIISFTYLASA